jgi:hypothetical protein
VAWFSLLLASVVVQIAEEGAEGAAASPLVAVVEEEEEEEASENEEAALEESEAAVLGEAVCCHIHSHSLRGVCSHGVEERHHQHGRCVFDDRAAGEVVEGHRHQGGVPSLRTSRFQTILKHLADYDLQMIPNRFQRMTSLAVASAQGTMHQSPPL